MYPRHFTCMHADTAGSCMYPRHQTASCGLPQNARKKLAGAADG